MSEPFRFIMGATEVKQLPEHDLPEIAFAGRSNVGKSSILGMLMGDLKAVRRSRSPGRTQTLNLFMQTERMAFVDLPGYGYAKLAKSSIAQMQSRLSDYMTQRQELRCLVLVVDIRRLDVSPLDKNCVTWCQSSNHQVCVAITKCDLVPKNKQLHHVKLIEKQLGITAGAAIMCSSKTGQGRVELLKRCWESSPC